VEESLAEDDDLIEEKEDLVDVPGLLAITDDEATEDLTEDDCTTEDDCIIEDDGAAALEETEQPD
jgi:hypothetical protein